jgi:hypothetical protein
VVQRLGWVSSGRDKVAAEAVGVESVERVITVLV